MMDDEREQAFLDDARSLLQDSAGRLDESTLADLSAARARAVTRGTSPLRRGWVWAGAAVAVAAAVVMTFSLWLPGGTRGDVPLSGLENMEDVDLLSGAEEIQFYQDLEFYRWLDNEKDAG